MLYIFSQVGDISPGTRIISVRTGEASKRRHGLGIAIVVVMVIMVVVVVAGRNIIIYVLKFDAKRLARTRGNVHRIRVRGTVENRRVHAKLVGYQGHGGIIEKAVDDSRSGIVLHVSRFLFRLRRPVE